MGDERRKWELLWGVIMIAAGFGVAGLGIGRMYGEHLEQSAAIKAGVGQWTVDKATGATKFVYGSGRTGDGD